MAKRVGKPGMGMGLFAAPVAPVSQQPNRQGAVEQELANWIRDRRNIDVMRRLEKGEDPVQPSQGVPPAANLTEAVTAATAIAGLHKGAAEIAMAERQTAEERAQRIAASAEERVEQAKTEATGQWQAIMTMQQGFAQAMLETVKASTEAQLAQKDALRETDLQRIDDKIQGLEQRHDMALAQKDSEIQRLLAERDGLRNRASLDDIILAEAREGNANGILGHLLGVTRNQDPSADPDHVYRTGIAQVKVAEAQEAVEDRRLEKQLKRERHQEMLGIYRGIRELIGQGRELLPHFAGQARGLERNGVPPGFAGGDDGAGPAATNGHVETVPLAQAPVTDEGGLPGAEY